MRWKRKTLTEKRSEHVRRVEARAHADQQRAAVRTERAKLWHREFAWWPHHDDASGLVYFLEFVWCRAQSEESYTKQYKIRNGQRELGITIRYPRQWEYRGGKDCPEIKTKPAEPAPVKGWTCNRCGSTHPVRPDWMEQ